MTQPTSSVMRGTGRNVAGQPAQGAEVWAGNTMYYDMTVVGTTDAYGHYRLELPHNIGTWKPVAHGGGVLGQPVNVYFGDPAIDTTTLELTFTPDGPFIDGRTVKPFTRRCDGGKITDVPVGRYRISATYAPMGVREALEVRAEGQEVYSYSLSSPATFRETLYGIRMEVSLRRP